MDLKRFRRVFPVTKKMIYLDHAANGPCSTLVSKAIQQFLSEWSNEGIDWMKWHHHISRAKNLFSKLIHADPDEIAMVPNTSTGVSLAAEIVCARGKGNSPERLGVSSKRLPMDRKREAWHSDSLREK